MSQLFVYVLFLKQRTLGFLLLPFLFMACTNASPDVKSLLSQSNSFKLTSGDLRIQELSELTSSAISATCDSNTTGFEYQLPTDPPHVWNRVPSTASGIFTNIHNQCGTYGTFSATLDLSSLSAFNTMDLGATQTIRFRDINRVGFPVTEDFRITYSKHRIADGRLNNGQGLNSELMSASDDYSLQGRVIHTPQLPTLTGTNHTLQGKVVFE